MSFLRKLNTRAVSLLICAVGFATAVAILLASILGMTPGSVNVAQYIAWIPVVGLVLVGILTWLVVFPKWQENRRVQKLVRATTGVGQAEREIERRQNHKLRRELQNLWFLGMASALVVIFLLRAGRGNALWTPMAVITLLAQLNAKQTAEERVRSLLICGLLLFTFGDVGRNWLSGAQGPIVLGVSLFGLVAWHFWQERRGVAEMQQLVREARYEQAIEKATLNPSPLAPALKAYAQFRQGLTAQAKDGLRQALARTIDSPRASFALAKYGELLVAEGQYQEARRPVAAALELQPDEARAHRVMAQTWLEEARAAGLAVSQKTAPAGSVESGLQQLSHLQTSAPSEAQDSGQTFSQALEHARKAVELAPGRGAELAVLAWALAVAGQGQEARETAGRAALAISDQLDVAEGRFFLGCAYQALESIGESKACFEAVKGAEPRGYYRQRAEQALAEWSAAVDSSTAAPQPQLG